MTKSGSTSTMPDGGLVDHQSPKRSPRTSRSAEKEITVFAPEQAGEQSDLLWNSTPNTDGDNWQRAFAKKDDKPKDLFSTKKEKPKSSLKTDTHFQGSVRSSKTSLGSTLEMDVQALNLSTQSLDSSNIFQKTTTDTEKKTKNNASTGALDAKLNRKPKSRKPSGSVCSEQPKQDISKQPSLSRKSHSSRNLNEPKEQERKNRRAHSVRELRVKDKDALTRSPGGESNHVRRSTSKPAPSSPVTNSGSSTKVKTPRKSVVSTRQLEIGPDGEVVAVVRKAPVVDGQERRKTIVVRRKVEGGAGEADNPHYRRQSSRRLRQSSSVRHKKELGSKDRNEPNLSSEPERHVPLRAPSGGAELFSAVSIREDEDTHRGSKSLVSTVGTADDLTDSEQGGAEFDLTGSPHNETTHSRSATSIDPQKSPRPKIRHRVRVTDMRQLGKQNARQIFMTAGKGVPLQGDEEHELSDESVDDDNVDLEGPIQPPAQFEIALDPLSRDSPGTGRNGNAGVTKRMITKSPFTKSPFKVAGKLFKKAQATATEETEYSLPGDLPLDDEVRGGAKEAIKTIEAIGITADQLEMLKKAGLKITTT